jgi:hypothetical protein
MKRTMLQQSASTFDPMGLLSPLTTRVKILFQMMKWKIAWDDALTPDIENKWKQLKNELRMLQSLECK